MAAKSSPSPKQPSQRAANWQKPTSRNKRSLPQRPTLRSAASGGETEAERGVPGSEEETERRSRPGRRNRQPFHSEELTAVVRSMKKSAAGQDKISPEMIKNLPEAALQKLLNIINKSWSQGRIPGSWRNAVIVPLLKNGKPASQINSYRPVSLLACVSKVIESMVTRRLKKWAADMGAIPPQQSVFQKGRMTLDVIANITQKAFDSLQRRERTVVVAFDRVWKFGLFRDLARRKLHPVALRWLKAYLLPVGQTRRRSLGLYKGALSPLLFCLATATLPTSVLGGPGRVR